MPVIWNIGAIAASGHPRAADTIRRILIASAAIPAAFPPAMIEVTLGGKTYQEMHVDGGAFAQIFLYPSALTRNRRAPRAGQPVVECACLRDPQRPARSGSDRRTPHPGYRRPRIQTMIASAGYNDVIRIYAITQRDDIDYNLAFIGPDFNEVLPSPFDPTYMRALYGTPSSWCSARATTGRRSRRSI